MSTADNALLLGLETTYGTAVTPTVAYEAKEDTWQDAREPLESVGFRAGLQTVRADRARTILQGGEGSIPVDIWDRGMLPLLRTLFGAVTGPALVGITDAHETTFDTTADGPDTSATVELQRSLADGGVQTFTHLGCVVTEWELTCAPGERLALSPTFDLQNVVTNLGPTAPGALYPAGALPYAWDQVAATVDGAPVDLTSFSLTGQSAVKTDRRFLRGSNLKKQPRRNAVPEHTGELGAEFENLTHYQRFVSGSPVPLVLTATGGLIETGFDFTFELTLPAVQYRGSAPTASIEEITMQTLPFRVLHDPAAGPAMSLRVVDTSTTL